MAKNDDKKIIYSALLKGKENCDERQIVVLDSKKLIRMRTELIQGTEKCLLYLSGSRYSIAEKRAYCDKAKKLYWKYYSHLKKNPELDCTRLAKNMDKLLPLIASFEAECLARMRESSLADEKIDLEQVLGEDTNFRVLMQKPIDALLKEVFADKDYTVLGEDNKLVYVSERGKKYHRKDCPYCKDIHMVSATLKKVENMKLQPCKCIESKGMALSAKSASPVQNKPYVTAFVDESIRKNPWCQLDESIPKEQGIYSYIVCEGMLESEKEITEENTLYTCVAPVLEANSVERAAIEAILAVLFALVLEGYQDNVLIYTDNRRAMVAWKESEVCMNMAKLFKSVMVQHVLRAKNTKADKLGRKRAILDIPSKTLDTILRRDKEVKKILEGWFAE